MCFLQEKRKKEREVEEKRLAAERAAEEERRRAVEVRPWGAAGNGREVRPLGRRGTVE